jgi:hypothetical protein
MESGALATQDFSSLAGAFGCLFHPLLCSSRVAKVMDAIYQQARKDCGSCATRLGSTSDALSSGNDASKPDRE